MTKSPEDSLIEPYRTSDTPFAAYLDYCGHTLVGIIKDPSNARRRIFVFIYSEDIPKLEQDWEFGRINGDLKKYHRSLKIVTRKVNEALRQEESNGK